LFTTNFLIERKRIYPSQKRHHEHDSAIPAFISSYHSHRGVSFGFSADISSVSQSRKRVSSHHSLSSCGAAAGTWTELPSDLEDSLSNDDIAFTAHTFSNAQVEVKDDAATDSIRIHVLCPGSHHQSDVTAMSSPGSPALLVLPGRAPRHRGAQPSLHNNEVSKIIGKMWRDESEPVKKQWKDKAENVKRQHLRDHPDYHTIFSPAPSSVNPFSSVTSPAQIVDLANFNDPSLSYSAGGDLAAFTLDSFQPGQLDLFTDLLEDHNTDMMYGPTSVRAPAACTSIPTAINSAMADGNAGASLTNPTLTNNDLSMAQSDLNNFESSLEEMLARELETMEEDGGLGAAVENGFQYNDLESQRFTEFLEQMPEHMWGMEFVN
ncbi:hypothetical protein KCV07_g4538, partial [Aureobasidium melanogenum]